MKLTPDEKRGAMRALNRLVQEDGLLARNILPEGIGEVDNPEQACKVAKHIIELCAKDILDDICDTEETNPEASDDDWNEMADRMIEVGDLIDRARDYGIFVVATADAYEMICESDIPKSIVKNIQKIDGRDMFTVLQKQALPSNNNAIAPSPKLANAHF